MPVRKIPKNYLHVTGSFASRKNGCSIPFESILEKDYLILLEFDPLVSGFEGQPVKVPVPGQKGSARHYVPDVLVSRVPRPDGSKEPPPLLVEVKHTSELSKKGEKFAPKFAAAKAYAAERDWEFLVVTEKDIRSTRLQNLKFLREYLEIEPIPELLDRILESFTDLRSGASVESVLEALCPTENDRLIMLPMIWHLVITGQLQIDMEIPVSNSTVLNLPR
ncbi:MAG: heteromeric transposase endonuclease subunit TnsA [Rhodocyclaceae bacterium]|nr:heteromeric transposase endonuclease subunit TnsA [Rhodocyclaceae bacterium]